MSGPSDRDEIAAVLWHASWPDGSHDGFPTKTVAGMLADAILASDWLAERDRRTAAKAVREFAHWVAVARAYNGSDHERGQSLYNECLNAVLPTWAQEWADEQQGRDQ